MTPRARPAAAGLPDGWRVRFRGLSSRERWGYGVWSLAGLMVAVPEIWAVAGRPPWPTISATVGHLEALWSPVAIIVVALIVAAAANAVRYPWRQEGEMERRPGGGRRGRTSGGRLTTEPGAVRAAPVYGYAVAALAVTTAGPALAAAMGGSAWTLAYVLYGLVAIFWVILPNALAFWLGRDLPFPTLLRTVADVERRWHVAGVVILAGLAVLLVHLALYPWPAILPLAGPGAP